MIANCNGVEAKKKKKNDQIEKAKNKWGTLTRQGIYIWFESRKVAAIIRKGRTKMELRTSYMYDIYIKGRVGEIEQSKQNKTKKQKKKTDKYLGGVKDRKIISVENGARATCAGSDPELPRAEFFFFF